MAHIAHQPGPVRMEGGVIRWLVGVVGLGAELHQRPHAARGVLLQFECLRKTRGVQAFRRCGGGPGRFGCLGLLPGFGGGLGGRIRCFATTHKPCQIY
jgi:hypothetical protein